MGFVDVQKHKEREAMLKSIVPARLKQIREEYNLTHSAFARLLNCSRNNVYYFESGERMVNIEYIQALADVFHINPNWLLGLSDQKKL